MRICSFVPSATEILFALGLGRDIVGVSHECLYPPAARRKPRIIRTVIDQETMSSAAIDAAVRRSAQQGTSLYRVDEQLLRRLRPELVLTQKLCEVCAIGDAQAERALASLPARPDVLSLHPHTIDGLLEEIRVIGDRTGRAEQAAALIHDFRARVAAVRGRLAGVGARPRVCCLEWLEPPMTAGHWVPEMVELAGGREVLGRAGARSRRVSWEEIAEAQPEVLLLIPCGFSIARTRRELSRVTSQPVWCELSAVRAGRVYLMDGPAYFNGAGPRMIEGIEQLAGVLHPTAFRSLAARPGIAPSRTGPRGRGVPRSATRAGRSRSRITAAK